MDQFMEGLKPLLEALGIQPWAYPVLFGFGIVHQFACGYLVWWTRGHSFLSAAAFALLFGVGSAVQERHGFTAGATHTVALLAAALLAEGLMAQLAKIVPWIPKYNEKVGADPPPPPTNQGGFMQVRVSLLLFAIISALTVVVPAFAASPLDAVSTGVGAQGVWVDDNPSLRDLEAAGKAAVSLTPHVSVVGSLAYGFNESYLRGAAGARLTATDVDDRTFSVGLGISRHFTSENGLGLDEWAGEAAVGWKPLTHSPVILTALTAYGLETSRRVVQLGVIFPIKLVPAVSQ